MLNELLSKIVRKAKGTDFKFDEAVDDAYLIRFATSKIISLIWGVLRMRRLTKVFIHPTSTIKDSTKIKFGKNLSLAEHCYIDALSKRGLVLGDNVSIGYSTFIRLTGTLQNIGQGMKVGNNVGLGTHCYFGSGMGFLEIGDDTIIGNYVSIHPENHNFSDLSKPIRLQGVSSVGGVSIGKNCWIGAKATILDGTTIGNHCIVAAGAVVRGVFPDNVIIGGVPAKIIKRLE